MVGRLVGNLRVVAVVGLRVIRLAAGLSWDRVLRSLVAFVAFVSCEGDVSLAFREDCPL